MNWESFSSVLLLVFEELSNNDSIQQKCLSKVFIYNLTTTNYYKILTHIQQIHDCLNLMAPNVFT